MGETRVFDLNSIILDDEQYNAVKQSLWEEILEDFSSRHEIVEVEIGEYLYEMTLSEFLTNLILLRPFNRFGVETTEDFLFDVSNFHSGEIENYFNKVIHYFEKLGQEPLSINEVISEVIEELSDISGEVNVRVGNTISLYSLIQAAKRNKRLEELLNLEIPSGLQFNEIEEFLNENRKELVQILSTEDNDMKNYLNSRTGINARQLAQTIMNIGLKPDLFGNIISEPINTNFIRGLRHERDFYINAEGGRKALITNFKQVKTSGYLTRKLSLLLMDTSLDYDHEDCGTIHTIKTHIDSKDTLRRLDGRWMVVGDELHLIEGDDESLIGKDIALRSPITCAHTDVCRTCYGDNLAKLNKDLHVGLIGTLILTNQLTQMLLSSKHLLETKSSKIDWPEEFLKYFLVDRNMITLLEPTNRYLVFDRDSIQEDEESGQAYVEEIRIASSRGGSSILINSPIILYLGDKLLDDIEKNMMDDGIAQVSLRNYTTEDTLFTIVMENNELSASLKGILDLIETKDHLGLSDINDIYGKFISLLNESGIRINSVHIELILRALMRDPIDHSRRPDFTGPEFPPYEVLRVTNAILEGPSVGLALAFERIKKQLTEPDIYSKSGTSILDKLL